MNTQTIFFKQLALFSDFLFSDLPVPKIDDIIWQHYPLYFCNDEEREEILNETKDPLQKELQF